MELRQDRIDLAIMNSGKVVNAQRLSIRLNADGEKWKNDLQDCRQPLQEFVDSHKLDGAKVVVYCETPSQSVDVISVPVRSSVQARNAAEMACQDTVSYMLDQAIADSTIVARDRSGSERRTHVVAAVERSMMAESIDRLLQDVGLKLQCLVPIEAPLLGAVTRHVLNSKGKTIGRLYIGEHVSFFAVASDGNLRFARRISLGVHAIAESLTREIPIGDGSDSISLDFEAATEVLRERGIVGRNDIVCHEHGIIGAQILPLMQPVLQRLIVEVRQSIRFGLNENERETLQIDLVGIGSQIRGLSQLMAEELGILVRSDSPAMTSTEPAEFNLADPAVVGSDLFESFQARRRNRSVSLLPNRVAVRHRTRRIRKFAWTGAILAIAAVAFDAVRIENRIQQASTTVQSLHLQANAIAELEATQQRIAKQQQDLAMLLSKVEHEMLSASLFAPALREVAVITPDFVRLSSLNLSADVDTQGGTLVGYVLDDGKIDIEQQLSHYLLVLKSSPLLRRVTLGSVQHSELDGSSALRFDVTFQLMPWSDGETIARVSE